MRFSKIKIISGLIVLVVAVAVILHFVNGKASDSDLDSPKFKEMKVERGTFMITVTANGVVQPIDRIEIKSKASGEVVELSVEQGDCVRKGDLLARLDQKDEYAAVAQAQADLDIAKAELQQAQRNFDRRNQLFQKNLISEEEWDQLELSLAVAKGQLVRATTALDRAKERLAESIVRAPIDGVILQKYVEKGQIIASGVSNVGGGTPIVDIADMSSVHVEAGIDEIDIGKIKIGQPVKVVADAYPQLQFMGKIVRIAPEAKIEQNVTLFNVIVEVENTEGKLKSGMNANIEITIVKKERILLASAMALQSLIETDAPPNEPTVLLKKGDEFVPHQIKIGLTNFKQVEILTGLNEGDIVGVPMTSRLKAENDQMQERMRSMRGFGTTTQRTPSR